MSRATIIKMSAVVALALLGACGDEAPKDKGAIKPAAGGAKAPGGRAASPVAQLAPQLSPEQIKEQLLADVRKRTLTNEDFVANENNRDPFLSFLGAFGGPVKVNKQHQIIFEKFALDELKLIAVINGEGGASKAMFVDPSSMGITIERGNHVSKGDALVTRIGQDRVFFEVEEDLGGGKTRKSERVVELHAGEVATQ